MEVTIDETLAARLVSAQFPEWADLSVKPVAAQGWDNRTFRLGDEMLLRMPSAEHYAAKVKIEQAWLPRLAPELPLPIPRPLAMGEPGEGYPWHWSVYRWLRGETANYGRVADKKEFAMDLAAFLKALHEIDSSGGPEPGAHNFYRGAHPRYYEPEVREALTALAGQIDVAAAEAVWGAAMKSTWHSPPVWFHGDLAATNLLVHEGRLSGVIDFGGMGVGDPACDLAIAWTFFDRQGRSAFREAIHMEEAWVRARGWALWKALITMAGHPGPTGTEAGQRALSELLASD